MFRILSALFLALGFHLLLFLIPFQQTTVQPQLTGKKGIDVQLHTRDNTPPAPPAPFQADTPAPVVVAKTPETVPETIVPESTAVIRLRKKTLKKRFPAIAPPSVPPQKKEMVQYNRPHNTIPPPAIVEAAPLYQQNPKPEYPLLARRRNWQGTVILSVVVSVEGRGTSIRIHRSSGYGMLDKSALQAVSSWSFRPGIKGATPFEMEVLVPVHFTLHN